MIWSTACPRCRGDLTLDSADYGPFVSCTKCGGVLTGPQERVLLGLAPSLPRERAVSGCSAEGGTEPRCSSGCRLSRRLPREDLLQLAIRLVREAGEDGPDFVLEVALVFEALKREVKGLTHLIESHERLESVAACGGCNCGLTSADTRSAAFASR